MVLDGCAYGRIPILNRIRGQAGVASLRIILLFVNSQ